VPGLNGLDVAAADIDMGVAELSVTGILRFAQWSQGSGDLDPALSCIAELFGAVRCSLVLVWLNDMHGEIVGSAEVADSEITPRHIDIFSPKVLGVDIRNIGPGDIRFLSRMSQLPFRLSGGVDKQLSESGIEDLSFICIGRGANSVDILELQYEVRPSASRRRVVEWIVPKLLRAYQMGKSSRVERELSEREKEVSRTEIVQTSLRKRLILHLDNPADLTRAEWKVCELASRGLSAKSIAYELNVSGNTVRTHLRNIYAKTDLNGFYELVYTLVTENGNLVGSGATGALGREMMSTNGGAMVGSA